MKYNEGFVCGAGFNQDTAMKICKVKSLKQNPRTLNNLTMSIGIYEHFEVFREIVGYPNGAQDEGFTSNQALPSGRDYTATISSCSDGALSMQDCTYSDITTRCSTREAVKLSCKECKPYLKELPYNTSRLLNFRGSRNLSLHHPGIATII